ncbi:MAG: COX15/CtaA family protein [Arenicella sp.]
MSGILSSQRRAVGIWLLICTLVVYFMIMIGGITRLTQSGLSMVEWEPIMGIIPPLNEHDWLESFEKYKAFPEYQKVNKGMSLQEYKGIFLWEYGHRVLGRFIGILFLLPYLFFLFRGYLPGKWKWKLLTAFALGGLQGLMGWYMVKSGLVNNPHVSQYRLAAHFGIALAIFVLLFWYSLEFLRGDQRRSGLVHLRKTSSYVLILVLFMMMTGAFVAGTKAGHIYNTFPLIAGAWLPDGLLSLEPIWRNFFENSLTIQFVHRCIAYCIVIAVLYLFAVGWRSTKENSQLNIRFELTLVLFLMLCQVAFGIITLLMKVPVFWGALHQSTAVALLASLIFLTHKVCRND